MAYEQEREPCPQPPPIKKPPKDDRLLWGTLAVLVAAGAFGVYAKRSPEVRDWLTIHAPWFDDLIAVAYQENMSYLDFLVKTGGDLKQYVMDYMNRPEECSLPAPEQPVVAALNEKPKPPPPPPEECEQEGMKKDPEKPCAALPPPILTRDICEIEACLKDLGETAIHNYMTARDACIYYNKLVQETMANFNYANMKKLHPEMKDRLDLVKKHVPDAECAHAKLNELTRYFECGVIAPATKMENTRLLLNDFQKNINTIRDEFLWENAKSLASDCQWLQVEEKLDKYSDETSTFYPSLDYTSTKPNLSSQDPDFLLHHNKRYVDQLECELNDARGQATDRVDRAVQSIVADKDEKEKANIENAIQTGYKKALGEAEKAMANRYAEIKKDNDAKLKEALKKQRERNEEILAMKLANVEVEANKKLDKMVKDKVAAEKHVMDVQLRDMAMKLAIVEGKLNARLKSESEQQRSQQLYAASSSLLAATQRGEPTVKVDRELRAIERASGDGDKLVQSVLHSIPNQVWDKGVVPESVLRDKYHSMEKVARKVALVEEDGAPLPIYFLSWLQSVLLFMKPSTIPQSELDRPPKEPYKEAFKNLDTFDLLQRASYWIERGNIAAALRYVSSLEGASRMAAASWQDAARCHVEIRQAAEALIAHAAAMGLQYV